MATNLTRHWLQAAQTIFAQTGSVRANPWDAEYPGERATIVWQTVRAFRRGYFAFMSEIKEENNLIRQLAEREAKMRRPADQPKPKRRKRRTASFKRHAPPSR